jgi:hypothetical protein
MVAGNTMMDDAKIGGDDAEMLIFRGRWVLWPP